MSDSTAVKVASEFAVIAIVVTVVGMALATCASYSARDCVHACYPQTVKACTWTRVECGVRP